MTDDHALAAELATAAGELLLRTREEHAGIDPKQLKDIGDRVSHDFLMAELASARGLGLWCAPGLARHGKEPAVHHGCIDRLAVVELDRHHRRHAELLVQNAGLGNPHGVFDVRVGHAAEQCMRTRF